MSLKDRLARAQRRTATHQLRVEDDARARADLAAALAGGDEQRIETAQVALAACYEELRLQAMPADDWDDLITAHPPPERLQDRAWCDVPAFLPAALAVCVRDSEVTEADWREYVGPGFMSPGEVRALLDAVVALHDRTPDPLLPKGSTGIPS